MRPNRLIGKDRDERNAGPYSFDELDDLRSYQYWKFRGVLSKLAYQAEHYDRLGNDELANSAVRKKKRALLDTIFESFGHLFPQLSFEYVVDSATRTVPFFGAHRDMAFVRPDDPTFSDTLKIPFSTLSDGELNALCLLFLILYHSYSSDSPILFLIDELENHLHPALQLKFIDHVCSILPRHAMILATTHSPIIMTNAPPESRILMVHSSEVDAKRVSNQLCFGREANIARIQYDLYGADSAVAAQHLLRDYHRAASAEAVSFAEECLNEAVAKPFSASTDPQRTFLTGIVQSRIAALGALRILDVGAGAGRLIKGLSQDLAGGSFVTLNIDAVEPKSDYRAALFELADDQIGPLLNNVFADIAAIPSGTKYDLILLHNTLHELWCMDLITVLLKCCELLEEGGILNVMEMAVLPEGENRFFVFTDNSLERFLNRIGFEVRYSRRVSHSGIPLYEIVAVWTGKDLPTKLNVTTALREAVEQTITQTVKAFQDSLARDNPIHLAFSSFNIAFGHLLLNCLAHEGASTRTVV
jgi:SAM-dependent methyltransferase